MGTPSISALPGVTPKQRYDASVDESKTLLFAGKGNVYKVVCENNNAGDVFLQFYDAATTGAVTVGTDIKMEFRIPSSGTLGIDSGSDPLKWFRAGCVVAVVDARGGTGAPGAPASLNSWYFNMTAFG